MDPEYNKVERTLETISSELSRFTKICREDGRLAQTIESLGGDAAYLRDIVNSLNDTIDAINDQLYSVGVAVEGMDESVTEGKQINESTGLLDANDEDGFMARSQLYFMARDAIKLHGMIGDRDELAPWVQSKITNAAEAMEVLRQHIEYKQIAGTEVAAEPDVMDMGEANVGISSNSTMNTTSGPSGRNKVSTRGIQSTDLDTGRTTRLDTRVTSGTGGNTSTKSLSRDTGMVTTTSYNRDTGVATKNTSYEAPVRRALRQSADMNKGSADLPRWHFGPGIYAVGSASYDDKEEVTMSAEQADAVNAVIDSVDEPTKKSIWKRLWASENQAEFDDNIADISSGGGSQADMFEQAEFDDGAKALNPETIAKNMMKAAKSQAAKKVKGL